MLITCTTEGCVNHNVEFDVQPPLVDEDLQAEHPDWPLGQIRPDWMGVFCGPCGELLHAHTSEGTT